MDADRQALAAALRQPGLSDWLKSQFSLDTPEQDLLSPETAGDVALSLIPGVGQLTAARDVARGIKAQDPVQTALAAASFIPFGKLAGALKSKIIAGMGAEHSPIEKLAKAEADLAAGVSPAQVWQEQGLMRGGEGKMKWEIPDQAASVAEGSFEGKLSDYLRHPELFSNYPEMKEWAVKATYGPGLSNEGGFSPYSKAKDGPYMFLQGSDPKEMLSSALHEAQHGVQVLEDFKHGTNPTEIMVKLLREKGQDSNSPQFGKIANEAWDRYYRSAGEVEAANVEARLKNSPAFNKAIGPFETQKYPFEQQIF